MPVGSLNWIGKILDGGRYAVLAKLGAGGMGFVFKARDQKLDAEVVVKAPRPDMLEHPQFAGRFAREIRSMVKLSHPHIVKVLDVGEHEGVPFAVMQYLSGGSLRGRQVWGPDGAEPLPLAALAEWLENAAQTLDFIHAQGYIHRDVKPDNILYDAQGHVYVSDFGLAKVLADTRPTNQQTAQTRSCDLLGTPRYMAPELLQGKDYDGRIDQYALAVTLYELLCGRPPFDGALATVIALHVTEAPPAMHVVRPELSHALSAAVHKGLAKEPQDRHASCAALAQAVLRAGAARPANAPAGSNTPAPDDLLPSSHAETKLADDDVIDTWEVPFGKSIAAAAVFLASLRKYKILEPAKLDRLAQKIEGRNLDASILAQKLNEAGWLTPYQSGLVLEGRGRDLVLGNYLLLDRLGAGGMGEVFKARHAFLNRIVAIKILRAERVADPQALGRFQREIRAAAHLTHPNIVLAFDADAIGDTHFFAMEYVEGTDLLQLVRKSGPLPIERACQYVWQVCQGLQYAHERGIVHRDIKPANLLLTTLPSSPSSQGGTGGGGSSPSQGGAGGVVKILDMGLSRREGSVDSHFSELTQDGKVLGTPDYIAPEQALNSRAADIRSDLYSLGCTFYYLLAGAVPFPGGDSLTAKLLKHQMEEPVPIERVRPDVPEGVRAILRRLLKKLPEERYQTPRELAAVLEPLFLGRKTKAPKKSEPPPAAPGPGWLQDVQSAEQAVARKPAPKKAAPPPDWLEDVRRNEER